MVAEIRNRIAESFAAQGLMATLGATLEHIEPGEVRIALVPHPGVTQQHGYVHAGAITSVLDSACGYAALTLAPKGHGVLTAEFKINFLRPADASHFVAIGRVSKAGKTLSVCQGEVIGEWGERTETVAIMQATMVTPAPRP